MYQKKEINVRIGQNIKKCRNIAGFTQEKLAEQLGLSPDHLSKIERGLSGISLETLERVCMTLGTTPDILFYGQKDLTALDLVGEKLKRLDPACREKLFEIINLCVALTQLKPQP